MPTRITSSEGELPTEALRLRELVFIQEQGIARDEELDGRDAECIHFLAWRGDLAAGCARLRPLGAAQAKVERVAVLAELRGHGVGRALMEAVEAEAARRGRPNLVLHAQMASQAFYDRLGWSSVGEPFDEAGVPHCRMEKRAAAG